MTSETPCVAGCINAEFHDEYHRQSAEPAVCVCGNPEDKVVFHRTDGPCHNYQTGLTAKPAEPPACRICGKAPAWNGGDWCRDCSRGKGEPQSEPRIEHRDVCHASYPCEDCGKVRSRAEGGTTFTVCDDCWDKRQSEPPIADGVGVGIANLFMGHEAETAGKVLARAYLALKAERDALKASIHGWISANAPGGWIDDLRRENAALKARVEELSENLLWATSSYEERVVILANREKRKEQEASNGK